MSLQIATTADPEGSAVAPAEGQLQGEHLTQSQMDELLVEPVSSLRTHLLHCDSCAAEFNSLQQSLHLFREATHLYAEQELLQLPERKLPARAASRSWLVPAYWATAAALVMAAILPIEVAQKRMNTTVTVPSTTSTSRSVDSQADVALLEEIDRTLSDSVPTSMQPLADPADPTLSTHPSVSNQTPQPRKD